MIYLNAGSGNPCAGHIKAIEEDSEYANDEVLSAEENLGLALPIGSKRSDTIYDNTDYWSFYLNAGSGNPWAGHTKAIDDSSENTTVRLLSVEENFGLALPMGSKVFDNAREIILTQNNYLKDGTGAPWAGHKSANILFSFLTKRLNLVSEENFGAAPPIGSADNIKNYEWLWFSYILQFCLNAGTGIFCIFAYWNHTQELC